MKSKELLIKQRWRGRYNTQAFTMTDDSRYDYQEDGVGHSHGLSLSEPGGAPEALKDCIQPLCAGRESFLKQTLAFSFG